MGNRRWMAWTGPLFAVVFFAATILLGGNTPGEKASAKKVVDYYQGHEGRSLTSSFLAPVLAALLVVFSAHLRTVVRDRYPTAGPGPSVLVSGGVLWASGILIGASLTLAVTSASHHNQNQVAQTLNVLSNDTFLPFIAGIAVTLIGAGMTVLTTGLLPRWMGWVALVVGIVSLVGPGGFLGFFVGPLWLLVAGILLWRETPAAAVPGQERLGV